MPAESKWLVPVKALWRPNTLEPPTVDPELTNLTALQRSAESFRYVALKTEYWISAGGTLREWLRLNCYIALILGIPALFVVPAITFLLTQFTTWTALLVQIAKNLIVFPILAILAVALISAVLSVTKSFISSRR